MFMTKARHWTYEDIHKIITNNLTEYKNLEFKSIAALHAEAKDEISKDVSSFANSAGGVIIYGIKEIKEGLDIRLELDEGVHANSTFSKEWLENIIDSRISPKISGLDINPVKLPNDNYIFVVIIPQSTTAHMAGNNRYYKRHNFKSEPMEDYEVRDVMNRSQIPRLHLSFTAPKNVNPDGTYRLQLIIRNLGGVFVRYFAVKIFLPEEIIKEDFIKGGRKTQLDRLWYREYLKQSNPNQYIFQGFRTDLDANFLPLLNAQRSLNLADSYIYWTIFTDKSGPQEGKTPLSVIVKNRLKT